MPSQNLSNELTHAAKLDPKRRGELAELAFMRKAASLGLAVAKPWGDSDRYDVIVRFNKTFWRVQIKSVLAKSPSRAYYRVQTRDSRKHTYSPEDIDFLVAYIFAEDVWYILPAHIVENKKSVCLSPGSKRARAEEYRGAWELMMQFPGEEPPDLRGTRPRKIAASQERTTGVPLANRCKL